MQTPVLPRTEQHEKTRTCRQVRENTCFSEVVGMLENAPVAAEGLEQPRKTREKHDPEGKCEAKPEAVFCDGVANVPALAAWLGDHLDDAELAELVRELAIVNNGHSTE